MSAGSTHPGTHRPWLSRRRFWILAVAGAGLLTFVAAIGIYYGYVTDVPLVISRETTHITEPLTADGTKVDYLTAVEQLTYPPEMATEANGYRLIVEELGVDSRRSQEEVAEMQEDLGLDLADVQTMSYQSPGDFLQKYAERLQAAGDLPADTDSWKYQRELNDHLDQPWTFDDMPMMEDWLNQNSPALDVVAEAVRKPVFRMPWIESDWEREISRAVNSSERQQMTSFARGFEARAQYRIASGDIDGAIGDFVSCLRVGRHLEHGTYLSNIVHGLSAQGQAYEIGMGGVAANQPTAEQWRRLLSELDHLPPHANLNDALQIERLHELAQIQHEAARPRADQGAWLEPWDGAVFSDESYVETFQDRGFGIDWNIVARRINTNCEAVLRGERISSSSPSAFGKFMLRPTRSREVGDMFSELFAGYSDIQTSVDRSISKENLFRIAIAMRRYEIEHATLPPAYSVDDEGNPLHSWRVLLLPYLGYDELHAQLRLDESWDSEHNQQFHDAEVAVYQDPSGQDGAGQTIYNVIEGETTAYNGGKGKRLDSFGPNLVNLILVSERSDPVCWMDPTQEVSLATAERGINVAGANGLGSDHERGLHAALLSGAVRFLSMDIATDELRALLEGTIEHAP
jgi:hypothetical protein